MSLRHETIYLLLNKTLIIGWRATGSFLRFRKELVTHESGSVHNTWGRKSAALFTRASLSLMRGQGRTRCDEKEHSTQRRTDHRPDSLRVAAHRQCL